MAGLVILPAIAYGLILGIVELVFLAQDESGMHWLKHGLHAIPSMIIFTFVAFNITWALSQFKLADSTWIDLGARVLIGLIAMAKVKAAASITGRGGVGEKWGHVIIIGALMMAGPYIWQYGLASIAKTYVPWIK